MDCPVATWQYHLEPLALDHLPQAVELDRLCLGGLWSLEGYEREWHSPNSDLIALIGHQTDPHPTSLSPEPTPASIPNSAIELVGLGCLWSILEEAHITLLFVHPDHRRRGLGSQVLRALLRSAQTRNLAWATLEVSASNQGAIALYQSFGFETVGRRKGYYQKTGEDALVLWCKRLQEKQF